MITIKFQDTRNKIQNFGNLIFEICLFLGICYLGFIFLLIKKYKKSRIFDLL